MRVSLAKLGSEQRERNEQQFKDLHITCYDVEKDE